MIVEDQKPSGELIYMIVGEAPGREEDEQGRPFVGRAGEQLDKILGSVGIDRDRECYITNVVDERPPGNEFGVYYTDAARNEPTIRLLASIEKLKQKVRALQPRIIICLGNEALFALTGLRGIAHKRGSLYDFEGIKLLPTIHPSAIIRGAGTSHWYLPVVVHDFKRAKEEAKHNLPPHEITHHVVKEPKQLERFFIEASLQDDPLCSFDIETTMKGGKHIKCIGFSFSENFGFVVPFQDIKDPGDYLQLMGIVQTWMTGYKIKWVAQNGYGFDINYIKDVWGFEVGNFFFDTMVAHHVLYPEFPHDLGFLASIYTRMVYFKDSMEENLYFYNAKDAVSTLIIAKKLLRELEARRLRELYFNYYHPLIVPLREMSYRGVMVDRGYKKELKDLLTIEIDRLQIELDREYERYTNKEGFERRIRRVKLLIEGGRKTIKLRNQKTKKLSRKRLSSLLTQTEKALKKLCSLNVRSTPDMQKFLYGVLKLPPQKKGGKLTTDETAIDKLFIKTKHNFLKTMIELRRTKKALSDYGNMRIDADSRVRTLYSFAETGRLKSGKFEAK